MSRIGRKPILIPKEVKVEIEGQDVAIKGPKGELSRKIPEEILVKREDDKIMVSLKRKTKKSPALWGLTRALLQNNVIGVSSGFEKKLEIRGVGYRASLPKPETLILEMGFSHLVELEVPAGLTVSLKKNIISISGADKQMVGEFAARTRRVKPPEPYKGKGIRYVGEKVRIKEGKKAATASS